MTQSVPGCIPTQSVGNDQVLSLGKKWRLKWPLPG